MNKQLSIAAKIAALIGAFTLTGCAFVPNTVHPTYAPPANVQKVPGADKIAVQVIVKNDKKHKELIGYTKDDFTIDMAGVYMHIKKEFTGAITKGLESKGFQVTPSATSAVHVDVSIFVFANTWDCWKATSLELQPQK